MTNIFIVVLYVLIPNGYNTDFEQICIKELNALRQHNGIKPLIIDNNLTKQCERYARKLAKNGKFIHDPGLRPDIAENIAKYSNPNANPIKMWQTSVGHYKNMMAPGFMYVGISMAYNGGESYFVMRLK